MSTPTGHEHFFQLAGIVFLPDSSAVLVLYCNCGEAKSIKLS
jgi:hypothetical protein